MTATKALEDRVRSLRVAFDRSFAEALDTDRPAELDFLEVRVSGDSYALRLSEVASIHVDRPIAKVPSPARELLGLSAFRGVLTPIFDFASLLGYSDSRKARWLVLAQNRAPIGFVFEAFERQLRVPSSAVSLDPVEHRAGYAARGSVQANDRTLPLIHLPSLVEGIARRINGLEATKAG